MRGTRVLPFALVGIPPRHRSSPKPRSRSMLSRSPLTSVYYPYTMLCRSDSFLYPLPICVRSGVRSADMYPGTAHCQLCMHTSYRSAHQLLRNTVNSSSDPAEVISHSASPMFELDRQSEFQYSTRSSIWPISSHHTNSPY